MPRLPAGCKVCNENKTCELIKRNNYLSCHKRAFNRRYKDLKRVLGVEELVRLEGKDLAR